MRYHKDGVVNLYQCMVKQYIILHPSKIHKYYIYYTKDRIEKREEIDFYYSEQAILECQRRIDFARYSPLLDDACFLIGRDYRIVRERIIEANKRRLTRMILNNVYQRPRLNKLKLKLQSNAD